MPSLGKVLFKVWRSKPLQHEIVDQGSSKAAFFVDSLYVENITTKDSSVWFVNGNGKKLRMMLDTGGSTTGISCKTSRKLHNSPALRSSNVCLKAYGVHIINHKGKVTLTCKANQHEDTFDFYVAMTMAPPILGLQACEKLGLIEQTDCPPEQPKQEKPAVDAVTSTSYHLTKEDFLEEFHDVVTDMDKFHRYHITIEEGNQPVIQPPRRVPQGLQDHLKEKLDQMEYGRIIAKTDKPMDWVNSFVIVEKKDGSFRSWLDPKDFNSVIRREHFQIPTFEDVVSRLGKKKYFTILDRKDSYWQVPVSEESSYLPSIPLLAETATYVCHLKSALRLRCCRRENIKCLETCKE